MNIEDALETVLVFIAVTVATYAVVSFTSVELLSSPLTVSSLILLVGFAAHLILVYTGDDKLRYAGYIILSVYVISVFTYLLTTFSVSPVVRTVALMLLSAGVLSGVYAIRAEIAVLSKRNLVFVIGVFVLTSGLLVGVDALTAEPTDKIVPADTVSPADDRQSLVIGQIVARNPSVLPKSYDSNSYVACVSEDISARDRETRPESIGYVSISDDVIWNQQSKNMEIPSREIAEYAGQNNLTVVKTDGCPSDLGNGTIAVYKNT